MDRERRPVVIFTAGGKCFEFSSVFGMVYSLKNTGFTRPQRLSFEELTWTGLE